jgi:hypothetical protein
MKIAAETAQKCFSRYFQLSNISNLTIWVKAGETPKTI